jgi:hypothetical protein
MSSGMFNPIKPLSSAFICIHIFQRAILHVDVLVQSCKCLFSMREHFTYLFACTAILINLMTIEIDYILLLAWFAINGRHIIYLAWGYFIVTKLIKFHCKLIFCSFWRYFINLHEILSCADAKAPVKCLK